MGIFRAFFKFINKKYKSDGYPILYTMRLNSTAIQIQLMCVNLQNMCVKNIVLE